MWIWLELRLYMMKTSQNYKITFDTKVYIVSCHKKQQWPKYGPLRNTLVFDAYWTRAYVFGQENLISTRERSQRIT